MEIMLDDFGFGLSKRRVTAFNVRRGACVRLKLGDMIDVALAILTCTPNDAIRGKSSISKNTISRNVHGRGSLSGEISARQSGARDD